MGNCVNTSWRCLLAATLASGLAGACESAAEPVYFPVVVEVVDADGAALTGASLTVGANEIPTQSGSQGNWSLDVRGLPGQPLPISVTPPPRYALRGPATRSVELKLDVAAGGKPLTVKERFVADSTARDVMLLLTLDCASAPADTECGRVRVSAGDEDLGTVGPDGYFSRRLTAYAGEKLRVLLRPAPELGLRIEPDTIVFSPSSDGELLAASRALLKQDEVAAAPPTQPPTEAPTEPPTEAPPPPVMAAYDPPPARNTPRVASSGESRHRAAPSEYDLPERPSRSRDVAASRESDFEPERPVTPVDDPHRAEIAACQRKASQKKGLGADCIQVFSDVTSAEATYVVAREALFNEYKIRRDWSRASSIADELVGHNDGDPEWHYWRGYLRMKQSRYREAASSLEAAHRRQNTWDADRRGQRTLQTVQNLAIVYTQLALKSRQPEPEDRESAIRYWEKARDLARQVNGTSVLREADRELARLRSGK